jgi:hypothetical protein
MARWVAYVRELMITALPLISLNSCVKAWPGEMLTPAFDAEPTASVGLPGTTTSTSGTRGGVAVPA